MIRKVLTNIYHKVALRLYSVGHSQYVKRHDRQLRLHALIDKDARMYELASVSNLSGKQENIMVGANSHIYGGLTVYNYGGFISIGNNCSLGDYSRIVSGKSIRIGNRVLIAHNVNILDNNSHPTDAKLRYEDFVTSYSTGMQEYDLSAKEIVIEDDVWIGFNSIVLKGVTIGRGAIIGAGSVVTKNVEPWTINVGNPLQCVKKLEPLNF